MKYFKNNDDLSEYIQSAHYGSDPIKYPFICFAAVIDKNEKGNYQYRLRFNCTGTDTDVYDTIETNERTVALKM